MPSTVGAGYDETLSRVLAVAGSCRVPFGPAHRELPGHAAPHGKRTRRGVVGPDDVLADGAGRACVRRHGDPVCTGLRGSGTVVSCAQGALGLLPFAVRLDHPEVAESRGARDSGP